MAETYIDEIESVIDEVSDWALEEINGVIEALAPDGRPFGTTPVPMAQQLDEYRLIRNNPDAWEAWGRNKALEITSKLLEGGTSQQSVELLNPINIASIMIIDYSSKMEALLTKEMI